MFGRPGLGLVRSDAAVVFRDRGRAGGGRQVWPHASPFCELKEHDCFPGGGMVVVGPYRETEFGGLTDLAANPRCAVCLSKRLPGVMTETTVEVELSTFCCAKQRG